MHFLFGGDCGVGLGWNWACGSVGMDRIAAQQRLGKLGHSRRRRLTVIGWVAHVRGRSGWSGTTSAAMLSRGRMGILKTGRQWKPR